MSLIITGIGARGTPQATLEAMEKIGAGLAKRQCWIRSGHAPGADYAFETGAGKQCIIYMPWKGFNRDYEILGRPCYDDNVHPAAMLRAQASVDKFHPRPERLSQVVRQIMARNYFQVMGAAEEENPSDVVVCWTADGKASGGTGQALRIAKDAGIPILNMQSLSYLQTVERLKEMLQAKSA